MIDLRDEITNEYFEWVLKLIGDERHPRQLSYRKLLMCLHNIEFIYLIPNDRNRAEDGIDLRRRFILVNGYEEAYDLVMDTLDGPCSVLEMLVALAIRCEEWIMDDPCMGDRTGQWFWGMISNLGLGSMTNNRFDKHFVKDTIERFLKREYRPNGKGGLFTIRGCDRDLRDVEIWYQLNWYLDSITDTDI